jgi:hypothetical protein
MGRLAVQARLLLAVPPACRALSAPCSPYLTTACCRLTLMVAFTAPWSEGKSVASCCAASSPCTSAASTLQGEGSHTVSQMRSSTLLSVATLIGPSYPSDCYVQNRWPASAPPHGQQRCYTTSPNPINMSAPPVHTHSTAYPGAAHTYT